MTTTSGTLAFWCSSSCQASGVGLLHSARQRIEVGAGLKGELVSFFWNCSLRIVPVYYLALAVLIFCAALGFGLKDWSWNALPFHVAYLSNVYQGHVLQAWQGQFSHLWSLSVEWQFYLLAGPLLLCIPARHHMAACLGCVALGMAAYVGLLISSASDVAIYTDSLLNFAFIALGGIVKLYDDRPLPFAGPVAWAAGLAILALALTLKALGWGWVSFTLIPPFSALLILGVAKAQDSWLVRLLKFRPLVHFGTISYGFYLFHNLIFASVPLDGKAGWLLTIGANFVLPFVLAAASYHLFEQPVQKLARRVGATPPGSPSALRLGTGQ